MISRRQYLYHSFLNATVLALALSLGAVLALTQCAGPQIGHADRGAAACGVRGVGVHLAGTSPERKA